MKNVLISRRSHVTKFLTKFLEVEYRTEYRVAVEVDVEHNRAPVFGFVCARILYVSH